MAKKESTFVNMVLTLLIVTGVAATTLGFVNKYTKDPIEQAKANKLKEAINVVVPGASESEIKEFEITPATGKENLTFYEVTKDGKLIGTAVKTYTDNGFSGKIWVMVGFDTEGNILDNDVLEHKETPGLGDKTAKSVSDWNNQFKEKNPASFKLIVKKDGGDVDAITAATISSRAYCDAIQRGYDAFMKHKNEGGNK